MLGRVKSIEKEDIWENGESTINFFIDFSEFTEQNKSFAIADWYDSNGNSTLTWMETKFYERNSKDFELFEMYLEGGKDADLNMLEIVEKNKWLNKYIEEEAPLSYVEWLEQKLDKNK